MHFCRRTQGNAQHRPLLRWTAGAQRIPLSPSEVCVRGGTHHHRPRRAPVRTLPVLGIEKRSGKYVVRTAGGEVHAEEVVFSGGGYARGVYRPVERAVLPIATYVVATQPLGARLKDAIACESAVYDTRFAFDYYRPCKTPASCGAGASPSSIAGPRPSPSCSRRTRSRSTLSSRMCRSTILGRPDELWAPPDGPARPG